MMEPSSVTIKALFIYPIKSCAGTSVSCATVGPFGFEDDRQFMIIDESRKRFLSQRQIPQMALIHPTLVTKEDSTRWMVLSAPDMDELEVPIFAEHRPTISGVGLWGDKFDVEDVGDEAADWVSSFLNKKRSRPSKLRLVHMLPYERELHRDHFLLCDQGDQSGHVSFADGCPFLIISRPSLDALNAKTTQSIPIESFRTNIYVDGPTLPPFDEDWWGTVRLSGTHEGTPSETVMKSLHKCTRCKLTTVDPDKGEFRASKEPLETLRDMRRRKADGEKKGAAVYFGVNFVQSLASIGQVVRVGDEVEVLSRVTIEQVREVNEEVAQVG